MHQIPCRDLVQAHCLRSLLAHEGIDAGVLDGEGILGIPGINRARLLVADEDAERARELTSASETALDESFTGFAGESEMGEEAPPAGEIRPSFLQALVFGVLAVMAITLAGLAILIAQTALSGGAAAPDVSLSDRVAIPADVALLVPLAGVAFGLGVWIVLRIARDFVARGDEPSEMLRVCALVLLFVLFFPTGAIFPVLFRLCVGWW